MRLMQYYYEGGWQCMLLITIWGIAMLFFAFMKGINFFLQKRFTKNGLELILLFGSLAIVTGFIGQAFGLFQLFDKTGEIGDIPLVVIIGGIRLTMIPLLYGSIMFFFSLIFWGIFKIVFNRRKVLALRKSGKL